MTATRELATPESEVCPHRTSHRYLTFRLGDADYGVPIVTVREIKSGVTITPIANAPAYVSGLMRLRGAMVPVVDLRPRLARRTAGYSRFTVIVLAPAASTTVGLVVDAVSEVLDLPGPELLPIPENGGGFVTGLARLGEERIALLDTARILDGVPFIPTAAR